MRTAPIAVFMGLLLVLPACGDSDPAPTPQNDATTTPTDSSVAPDQGPVDSCLPDCNGALANNPTGSCQAYDASYASGTVSCTADCQVDVSQCVAAATPGELSPEYGGCATASDCVAGLECIGGNPAGDGICGTSCAGDGDTSCGPGRECLGLTAGGGLCFNQDALRDQPCLGNGSTCMEGEGECVAISFDNLGNPTETRCKLQCDGGGIGTQGTCPAGETCVANPVGYITTQTDANGANVPCTEVGEQDICDTGFSCFQTSTGQTICAQQQGWCGDTVPLCGDLSTGGQNCGACGAADGHTYCAIQGAVGEPAIAECFIPENAAAGVCLGYCESDEGADLDCGTGYECVVPPLEEALYVVPQGGEQQVPCTDDSACDAADGFTCIELSAGSTVCARPLKMCRTAAP